MQRKSREGKKRSPLGPVENQGVVKKQKTGGRPSKLLQKIKVSTPETSSAAEKMSQIKREPQQHELIDLDAIPDVNIKQEPDRMVVDQPKAITVSDGGRPASARTSDLVRNALRNNPALAGMLYRRHRIQTIVKDAQTNGIGLSPVNAARLKTFLEDLSMQEFKGGFEKEGELKTSKVGAALKLLFDARLVGDEIAEKAKRLYDRWFVQQDLTPGPLGGDELVSDSEDDYSSDESSVAAETELLGTGLDLLRGINIVYRGPERRKSYILDRRYPKRMADVFGHNGLTVGTWWPFQLCALRDGAHGSRIGGIHGRIESGAYSVVISGGSYDQQDDDQGDVVYYSGSRGSEDDESARDVAPITNATRAMIMSTKHARPVRVLRSANKKSRWAPSVGIRYDGLYRVVCYQIRSTPDDTKKFYQFELRRQENQPQIDRDRPNAEERRAFAIVKGGR